MLPSAGGGLHTTKRRGLVPASTLSYLLTIFLGNTSEGDDIGDGIPTERLAPESYRLIHRA